jgi:hypothetical protein
MADQHKETSSVVKLDEQESKDLASQASQDKAIEQKLKALASYKAKVPAEVHEEMIKNHKLTKQIDKIEGVNISKRVAVIDKTLQDNVFSSPKFNVAFGSAFNIPGQGDLEVRYLEYSFDEIGQLEDLESIVARAFDRKSELVFKQGYSITGKSKNSILYVKNRLDQIEEMSEYDFDEMMVQITADLIAKSNAFLWKKRAKSTDPKISSFKIGGQSLDPISEFVVVPPECVRYVWSRSKMRVVGWVLDGYSDEIIPFTDIVHFVRNRKTGFVAGTPDLVPTKEDILSLRRTERDIEILIHLYVFPILAYKMGDKEDASAVDFDLTDSMTHAAAALDGMMHNGGVVLPPGDDIKNLQSQATIDYQTLLKHLKVRVHKGLGVSPVDLGEGDTTNRATAEQITGALIDSVKSYQVIISKKFLKQISRDLIRESRRFNISEKTDVIMQFNEVDVDFLVKRENHASILFSQNIVTHAEARNRIGLDPLKESEEEDLFAFKIGKASQTEGSQNLSENLAEPKNQNTDKQKKAWLVADHCIKAFSDTIQDSGVEVTRGHLVQFKKAFRDYYVKNFSKSCSDSILDVKIQVAKGYFSSLAAIIIENNEE